MSVTSCDARTMVLAGQPDSAEAPYICPTLRLPDSEDVRATLAAIRSANADTYDGDDVAVLAHRALIATGGPRVTQAQMEALGIDAALIELADWSAA